MQTRTRLGLAWIQPIESGDREDRNDASILSKVVEDDGMKMSDVLMVVCVKLEMGVGYRGFKVYGDGYDQWLVEGW